jgi:hypothetical protein
MNFFGLNTAGILIMLPIETIPSLFATLFKAYTGEEIKPLF